jgi:hypothetical protein
MKKVISKWLVSKLGSLKPSARTTVHKWWFGLPRQRKG